MIHVDVIAPCGDASRRWMPPPAPAGIALPEPEPRHMHGQRIRRSLRQHADFGCDNRKAAPGIFPARHRGTPAPPEEQQNIDRTEDRDEDGEPDLVPSIRFISTDTVVIRGI